MPLIYEAFLKCRIFTVNTSIVIKLRRKLQQKHHLLLFKAKVTFIHSLVFVPIKGNTLICNESSDTISALHIYISTSILWKWNELKHSWASASVTNQSYGPGVSPDCGERNTTVASLAKNDARKTYLLNCVISIMCWTEEGTWHESMYGVKWAITSLLAFSCFSSEEEKQF